MVEHQDASPSHRSPPHLLRLLPRRVRLWRRFTPCDMSPKQTWGKFWLFEKCFDLSLKSVWWLLFHSTCKKQSALGMQDKISHLENLFLISKGSICWSKYYTKILEHVHLNPGSRHIAHSGAQTLQFKIYWWQHINRTILLQMMNHQKLLRNQNKRHKFLVVSFYVNTKSRKFMNFSLKLHKNKTILTQPDQWPVTTRLQCKV